LLGQWADDFTLQCAMKALKIAALALLGVLVLIAIALGVIASRFDPAWAKQKLVQAVYEQKQRSLRLDGNLELSFYPSLGVKLGKASLSERNSTQDFATVDSARVSVRLLPLLSRQAVVDRIELDGMHARIVRNRDGSFNFDDLLSKARPAETGKAAGQPKAETTPVKFDIAGVTITDSTVDLRDDKAGRALTLSELNLKTGRLSDSASGPLDLRFKASAEQPKLNATLILTAQYRYDLARQQYALERPDLNIKGDALSFKDLDAAFNAKEAGVGGGQGGIQVESLAATAKGRLGDDAIDAQVNVPHLALLEERASGQSANASLRLAGKQRQLDAKLNPSAVEGSATEWKIGKLAVQWDLHQGALAAKGDMTGTLQADLKARAIDLPKLSGELEIAHPQMPMKQLKLPLDASLHADWGKSQAAGSLSTRMDESAIQGKWQVLKFSPLSAGFDVTVDRLDIDRYFPEVPVAKPAGGAAPPAPGKPAAAPAPIDLSLLRGLDLQGAVRIGALQARNLKLNNVASTIAVHGGRVDLNPLSANLYGGSLAGSLSAQAEGNRVALKQTLNNVAIGPLLRDYARKDILEGRGHVAVDVTASGNTQAAMTQSLAGSASFNLRDGAVKGINLAKTLRQAKSMLGKQDTSIASDSAEQTDFSELSASFKITGGVARNDDLSGKSPFLRATGAGTIDLPRSQIDYLAKVTIVNTSQGQQGKELADLNGLTIPVHLTGPLEHPSYRLELGALASELAKQQVQKQLQQQLEKQLDKKGLSDALKGLIK